MCKAWASKRNRYWITIYCYNEYDREWFSLYNLSFCNLGVFYYIENESLVVAYGKPKKTLIKFIDDYFDRL